MLQTPLWPLALVIDAALCPGAACPRLDHQTAAHAISILYCWLLLSDGRVHPLASAAVRETGATVTALSKHDIGYICNQLVERGMGWHHARQLVSFA